MDSVDEFIFFDVVQYTRRDWRNRNKIKTGKGFKWLTIPVDQKGNYFNPINSVKVTSTKWISDHLNLIYENYRASEHFEEVFIQIKDIYKGCEDFQYLSEINMHFIHKINELLKIKTIIRSANEVSLSTDKSEKLIEICKEKSATHYLSGTSALSYLDVDLFNQNGIEVEWMNYQGYKAYPQQYPPFEHGVSILDLLLNVGIEEAEKHIKERK